ncbi:formylglycine-generating enzyme family protein [Parvibaculum sp.]|uniref:formylglycine-generating enzyme family protein n=1 Tax=Parvibaculum sp. TaxID=2024848 RepID=UPI001E03C175|nr:formylglycine-generating enzyme family protein [Parvibaculum sp.]MBX3488190.1 formylglycine-generating enzyme family protein [Parvibaculum sp.]MCW5727832.1 formylglycine-generating enzyme family protein [Parvibaculum sp.]
MIRILLAGALIGLAACGDAPDAFKTMRDCDDCPTLIVLPPGSFMRGADETDPAADISEHPRHEVQISKPFAMATVAVTVAEFTVFADATGHEPPGGCYTLTDDGWRVDETASWRNPGFPQDPSHPVVCVSWHDATAYAAWMTERTGKPYRLPSEAEWEYAARGGTTGMNFWGDDDSLTCDYASVNDITAKNKVAKVAEPCDDGFMYTSPVGSFRPNPFGLYDVVGNAWVWLADCWLGDYRLGPRDGSPNAAENCGIRVLRGGSWTDTPGPVRIGARESRVPGERLSIAGFRLVRDLE